MKSEKALYWALLALLVWLPVPLGSNRGWAWAVMDVAAYGLLAWWLVLWAFDKVTIEDPLRKAWPVFVLLEGLYAVHQALASFPMPKAWVQTLSPAAAEAWAVTDVLGISRDWITLSWDIRSTTPSYARPEI